MRTLKLVCFLAILAVLLLAGCASQPAPTPDPTKGRDQKYEQELVQQLQGINPVAVPVFQEATRLLDANDLEKAKPLFEQVIVLAPGFSAAYRRIGYVELNNGNTQQAIELGQKAVDLEPNAYNQSALALALLTTKVPADNQKAFNLASAAVEALPDDEQGNYALCYAAMTIDNATVAQQAAQHLIQLYPTHPLGHFFAGVLAAQDGKWELAESELIYAQKLGYPASNVQSVLDLGVARNALLARSLRWGVIALVLWLVGLGALFLGGNYLSKATLLALNTAQPPLGESIRPAELRIRSIYRWVISVLSLYFYISIPFVILLLLLVVGGIFYIFLSIGTVPIQFSVILIIMLITSLFAILRTLFFRAKNVTPGRELRQADAPALWALVKDVANRLGIRPADAVYITPGVEIFVYEKGSILQKLRGRGQRNLVLGMGMLQGLTQGQLAAIFAHEYGHFSNQDTAGGDLAHQVYASLDQLAFGLARSGATQFYNPVWLFVMAYQRIFLRVALGASRLQEVLADRYAAMAYGSQNFIDGLKGVIRETIAFPLCANDEIQTSLQLQRPVSNLYRLPMPEKLKGTLEKQLEEALKRVTSQYDSHPAPQERIDLVERLAIPYSALNENSRPATELFPNPEQLQSELTSQVMKNVKSRSAR